MAMAPINSTSGAIADDATTGGVNAPNLQWFVFALFLIFGGITSLNDIIIRKLKELFALSHASAMLMQFAFFLAYAIFSIPAAAIVRRMGYMRTAAIGLLTMTAGCLLFIPTSQSAMFGMFLVALFVLGAGITIFQVVANPLISLLGRPSSAHSRLAFAQAFNSLGTTIYPRIGSKLILGGLAGIAAVKSFDTFESTAIPSLNKMLVLELARFEYALRRENIIAPGNSGTGKTHVALAPGLAAFQKGFAVTFTTAAALVSQLLEARDERRLLKMQRALSAVKLLIIDELGYVPLSPTGAELLFKVFSQRYERGSTIVTSNLPFEDWTQVLGSERLTGALLDRLTHHVSILTMNGDSYRLKQSAGRRRSAAMSEQNPATEVINPETGEIATA